MHTDRPQLYDVKTINKYQENIAEALKMQINRNHNGEQQTFQKLSLKINELRALGSSHALHLQWFRSNWSRLKLPPLFAEIFDIPKSSSFANQQQQQQQQQQQLQQIQPNLAHGPSQSMQQANTTHSTTLSQNSINIKNEIEDD